MTEPASYSLFSLAHSKHVRETLRVFFDCLDPMNKYEQVKGRARQETPHTVVSPSPPNTNRVITPNFGRRRDDDDVFSKGPPLRARLSDAIATFILARPANIFP